MLALTGHSRPPAPKLLDCLSTASCWNVLLVNEVMPEMFSTLWQRYCSQNLKIPGCIPEWRHQFCHNNKFLPREEQSCHHQHCQQILWQSSEKCPPAEPWTLIQPSWRWRRKWDSSENGTHLQKSQTLVLSRWVQTLMPGWLVQLPSRSPYSQPMRQQSEIDWLFIWKFVSLYDSGTHHFVRPVWHIRYRTLSSLGLVFWGMSWIYIWISVMMCDKLRYRILMQL